MTSQAFDKHLLITFFLCNIRIEIKEKCYNLPVCRCTLKLVVVCENWKSPEVKDRSFVIIITITIILLRKMRYSEPLLFHAVVQVKFKSLFFYL